MYPLDSTEPMAVKGLIKMLRCQGAKTPMHNPYTTCAQPVHRRSAAFHPSKFTAAAQKFLPETAK